MEIQWKRAETTFTVDSREEEAPGPVLWITPLPGELGYCLVTMFDEETPEQETNAYIYSPQGKLQKEIQILENEFPVRFLGFEFENGRLFILGANNTKYQLSLDDFSIIGKGFFK